MRVVSFTAGRFSPAESPHYPLNKRLVGPQSWRKDAGEEINLFVCLEPNDIIFYLPPSFTVTVTITFIPTVLRRKITLQRVTDKGNKMMLTGFIWLKVGKCGRLS
jgi:hypothetical protein